MLTRADAIIIGGGIIGTSIGYYLCKRNKKVAVIEKEDLAAGASGSCDQFVIMQSKIPGIHLEIAMASARLYQDLAHDLNFDFEHHVPGGMIVIEHERELEVMKERVKVQRQGGLEVEILDIKDARRMQPNLSPNLTGAAHCPMDAHVNSLRTTEAFARNIIKMGGKIFNHTEVTGVIMRGSRVQGVHTTRGEVMGDVVINAAGVYAPAIGEMVGVEIPIKPRRGQLVVTEAVPEFATKVNLSARYLAAKHNPELLQDVSPRFKELGIGLSLSQTRKGNIIFGASREFQGYDRRTTREGIKEIVKNVVNIFPGMKRINMIRNFAGLRPYTPDGLPILGTVDGVEGFVVAAGHEGDGICLAPITGQLISQYVCGEKTDFDLSPFSIRRFENM